MRCCVSVFAGNGLRACISQEEERKKMLEAVRSTYDQILTNYPLNDVRPQAALERAPLHRVAGRCERGDQPAPTI